jgi:hypothetical protein
MAMSTCDSNGWRLHQSNAQLVFRQGSHPVGKFASVEQGGCIHSSKLLRLPAFAHVRTDVPRITHPVDLAEASIGRLAVLERFLVEHSRMPVVSQANQKEPR